MNPLTKSHLSAYGSGLIFALGLVLSGMTQPEKVISFLRIGRDWDASLAFVMIGAIGFHTLAYHRWLKKRTKPLLAKSFSLPGKRKIDVRLMTGAALFGLGWGLAGYCPGPALVSAMSFDRSASLFLLAMVSGMALFQVYEAWRAGRPQGGHS